MSSFKETIKTIHAEKREIGILIKWLIIRYL